MCFRYKIEGINGLTHTTRDFTQKCNYGLVCVEQKWMTSMYVCIVCPIESTPGRQSTLYRPKMLIPESKTLYAIGVRENEEKCSPNLYWKMVARICNSK